MNILNKRFLSRYEMKSQIYKESILFFVSILFLLYACIKTNFEMNIFSVFVLLFFLFTFSKILILINNILFTFEEIENNNILDKYFASFCLESNKITFLKNTKNSFFKDIDSLENWKKLIFDEDIKNFNKYFDNLLNKEYESFEYRIKNKMGSYIWIKNRSERLIIDNKEYIYFYSEDINDKRILIDFDSLINISKTVIFRAVYNDDLILKDISKSISLYGYDKNDFIINENKLYDFVYYEDVLYIKNNIKNAVVNNIDSLYLVFRVKEKNNNIKWVSSRIIIKKDSDNKVFELYGSITDITELKVNELDLKEKIDYEVEKNIKKDRLLIHQNKLASMGEMLGNIAHQWRQPLNNISLLTYFIRDNYFSDNFTKKDLDENISEMRFQIEFMSNTIDDFRNFYKPNKDKNLFSVKKAIHTSYKIVKTQFESSKTELIINNNDIKICTYENEFQQVIVNILNNSNDAAINKLKNERFFPLVDISILELNNKIMIEIENNCGPANKEVLARMFEPYFSTKFENKGTGIGLYMCKIIIEKNMKGSISALNTINGVKFIIILPI